jgi:hypothetical protein
MKGALALSIGLLAMLALASPVSAATVRKDTGVHGDWTVTDTNQLGSTGATCGYGQEFAPDFAYFRWMKARAPIVFATDSHPAQEDSQKVTWQFKIQRLNGTNTPWITVATSSLQHARAYDDKQAPFTDMKLYWKGENAPGDGFSQVLRVLAIIKWYTPGGAVAGVVQYSVDNYSIKAFGATYLVSFCSPEATAG